MKRFSAVCLTVLILGVLVFGCTQMSAEEIAKKVKEITTQYMKGVMIITANFQGRKKVIV